MNILWKGAAVLGLTVAAMGAAPAQAQYYGGYGYRDGYRGDRYDDRRWDGRRDWRHDDRRDWRGDRRYWRGHYRQRCWTEWRYNHYRDRRVKVRICN
ncbi:hypothetical protein [Sphingobium chlorophenolicum]|uniref:Uncharacterized protein n=1 Tax=Sphingobium chlorophenolicum TaxID=46429 RepID=A0A081RD07_SPHCR|nr:hypothetical protein [Sphingobium chlorophenolicum]KEQ53080.1 putative uncharacterized protein precursor [Sphingobium chlorophenolicum]